LAWVNCYRPRWFARLTQSNAVDVPNTITAMLNYYQLVPFANSNWCIWTIDQMTILVLTTSPNHILINN